jgi:predicted DNA-binding protein (UPF0251 family)
MARPKKHRRVHCNPRAFYFKPRGIPMHSLDEVIVDHDELEALRLADILNHSHEDAAEKMKVSRATFGRIIGRARQKTADGILNGKAIRINEEREEYSSISKIGYCKGCGRGWKSKLNSGG